MLERPRKRGTPSDARIFEEGCIFCGKEKYVNCVKEKLVTATQLRVGQTLRETALRKYDDKIIGLTSRDIVAAEAQYHRSCYRNYTRPDRKSLDHNLPPDPEDDVENCAFSDLFDHIREEVMAKQKAVNMTHLTSKLELFAHAVKRTAETQLIYEKAHEKKNRGRVWFKLKYFPQ